MAQDHFNPSPHFRSAAPLGDFFFISPIFVSSGIWWAKPNVGVM